jgi:hypothetical protein
MPGLATRDQIDHLKELTGAAAEKYFLELMIAHLEGAIAWQRPRSTGQERVVVDAATGIVATQSNEIEYSTPPCPSDPKRSTPEFPRYISSPLGVLFLQGDALCH